MSNTIPNQWMHSVQTAFPDPQLHHRIFTAAAADPSQLPQLFEDISQAVLLERSQPVVQEIGGTYKKRKLEENGSYNHSNTRTLASQLPLRVFFECKDVSVQAPIRKKLKIELAGATHAEQIRFLNATSHDVEYGLHASDVHRAFCLPMPEKQARQTNFVLFPKDGALDTDGRPAEQVLFVLNETPPAAGIAQGENVQEGDTYATLMERAITRWLQPEGLAIIKPSADEFASSISQSHRKGEKAYHVKAHRGSKEGYLFFLHDGIIFGFKKPLAFFEFGSISSVSYTSVLQRTFNLVIATMDVADPDDTTEVEFSMLDQEDFAGIDAYVKKHGLSNASMAAERRAKAYNVNKEKKQVVNGDAAAGSEVAEEEDGQTELQKAEQQLQDEEDEEEEDYEASGGESEGEGEDSEEEEEYGDEEIEEVEGEEEEGDDEE